MPHLAQIYRYPVKGLAPELLDAVALDPGRPLPHDRRFALAHGSAVFEGGRPHWIRRSNFLQRASNARLAKLQTRFDENDGSLAIALNGVAVVRGLLSDPADRAVIEEFVVSLLGDELHGRPRLVEIPDGFEAGADGQTFADTGPPHVSLINLATVRELGRVMDSEVAPLRFRGNLYLEAEPWQEFDWLGKELQVGQARLRIARRIGRCAATTVNPQTAERDLNIPRTLLKTYGHTDCGVYAVVTTGGTIRPNDPITVAD